MKFNNQISKFIVNITKGKYLRSFTKCLGLTLVFVWRGTLRERFNFCFEEFFVSIDKGFILAGGSGHWVIILWGLGTFLIFPNFLRS